MSTGTVPLSPADLSGCTLSFVAAACDSRGGRRIGAPRAQLSDRHDPRAAGRFLPSQNGGLPYQNVARGPDCGSPAIVR
ncbi:hypothetical protein SR39_21880 [Methylobacterium radiotolerans]|nr:hypothetical protein SR39_21880 [Methylobacterium radiotolerans]